MSYTKTASRFIKPKSVYLNPVKKPYNNVFHKDSNLQAPSTKVLNTCNNAAGGGAYVSQCKRVTFRIHPTAPDSFHAREYLQNNLSEVAKKYDSVSFYVTESQSRLPCVIAHYLNGYQEEQRIDHVHEDILKQFVEKYCNYSGDIQKGRMNRHQPVAHSRSIQGMWNPHLNSPQPDLNAPLSLQELKDKHRAQVDVNKYRGLAPEFYKRKTKLIK